MNNEVLLEEDPMIQTLFFSPGQQVNIFLEIKDGYGSRVDALSLPFVSKVIFPGLTLAAEYPQDMVPVETGLYYYQFILPTGAASVGSYLVDVSYIHPETGVINSQLYQILVSAPFGNFSVSVGV